MSSGVYLYMSKPVNQNFLVVHRVHDDAKSSPLVRNSVLHTSHPSLCSRR
jgi:hypothetical protein